MYTAVYYMYFILHVCCCTIAFAHCSRRYQCAVCCMDMFQSALDQLSAVFVVASDSEDLLAELANLRGKVDALKRNPSHSRWLPQSVNYCVVLHDASQSDPAR